MTSRADQDFLRETAFEIIETEGPPSNRRSPDGETWTITDLCVLRDWMNRNIRYQKDTKTHAGKSHKQTGPVELLRSRREDCEDHGMLFGSLALVLGAYCRLACVYTEDSGHAFAEVCLGHSASVNISEVEREIRAYHRYRADWLTIPDNAYVFCSSHGAPDGWSLDANGQPHSTDKTPRFWRLQWSGIAYYQTDSGHIYLIADSLFGRYLGDISSFVDRGYRVDNSINIHRSPAAVLEKLDGVGPELAARIIDERPFDSIDDLTRVSGIGPALLSRIRPQLSSQRYDPTAYFWKACRKCQYRYPGTGDLLDINVYQNHSLDGPANGWGPDEAMAKLRKRNAPRDRITSHESPNQELYFESGEEAGESESSLGGFGCLMVLALVFFGLLYGAYVAGDYFEVGNNSQLGRDGLKVIEIQRAGRDTETTPHAVRNQYITETKNGRQRLVHWSEKTKESTPVGDLWFDEVVCVNDAADNACYVRNGEKCGLLHRIEGTLLEPVVHTCTPSAFRSWAPCEGQCFSFDDGVHLRFHRGTVYREKR